jgi:diguanylate cyclase (GGDEF)-like protein/PAS domain S-box-containing protein
MVSEIHRENANLATAFEEHARRTISGFDDSLIILKEEYESAGSITPVIKHVLTRVTSGQVVNHMIIFDHNGNVITSSTQTMFDLNTADREYFAVHRRNPSEKLHIGKPIIDRIVGKDVVPISRRINGADGSFGGVVVGLVSVDYFGDFYRQMELGEETLIGVAGLDGIIRVRLSGDQVSTGLDVHNGNLFQQIKRQAVDSFIAEYTSDSQRRFVSYRVMPDYPLFVNVGTHVDLGLDPYYQHRRWYWIAVFCFNLVVVWGGTLLVRQINRMVRTKQQLAASEDRYRTIFEAANDGIYVHDAKNGEILDINDKACALYGYTREELLSRNVSILGTGEPPYSEVEARKWLLHAAGEPQLFEWKNRHKQGHDVWMEVSLKHTTIGNADRIVAIVRDISERRAQDEMIRRMAYYDTLTGLPNRAYLIEALDQELKKAGRDGTVGAVIFVDLDELKIVNDTFGHSCGDEVITIAGRYLLETAGEGATVARLGGDEFIIMIPNQSDRAKIAPIAENIVKLLGRNYEIGESSIYMSASVGISLYPTDGSTAQEVLKKADLALYDAKLSGKNTWCFYEGFMEKGNYENILLKNSLRGAIERGELSLQYQPIVPTNKNGLLSFEALLRWTSIEYGSVPPGRFIPLAEESETIRKIGKWVLEEACQFIRKLSDMEKSDVRVWVNVSPRQLASEDFVALVRRVIDNAGIQPSQLGIEITEHSLIASLADSTHKLEELRQIGIHLAIDDFGTGYSSLTYLRNLPVQTIKIDKSFIDEIASDPAQLRFMRCILNLAHVQGLSVVAEGVETQEQLDKLVRCKCDYIQGYIFSRPISEQAALQFLEAHG